MSTVSAPTTPLGNLIRLARLDNAWSQAHLGAGVGVAQSIVSAWENGKTRPSAAHILKLADVLEVDRAALWDALAVEEAGR